MSGRKTTYTTISDNELRDLRNRAARATSLQESNRLLNQLSAKNEAALAEYRNQARTMNRHLDHLNQRLEEQGAAATREAQALRAQLQQTIKDSNIRFQELSQENEERVREMHQNFTSELSRTRSEFSNALDQTREDVANAINTNNRRIEEAMRQNNQRLEGEMHALEEQVESELQSVHDRLDHMDSAIQATARNHGTLLEMAREYERMTQMLLEEIQENYRVELLCPGRLKPVTDASDSARREIQDASNIPENSATARREARSALEEAYRLYQDAVSAEQRWQLRLEATRQMIGAATAQLEASRRFALPEEPDAAVDVDCWSAGDLSAIESRLESLEEQLERPEELAFSDLDGIQSAGLQISREIDDTSMFAVEAFYASQDRGEIAQDIADQLGEMGLSVMDHSYQGNDQRSAHRLHLRNPVTRFEIVITQTPVVQENGSIGNQLESDIIEYGSLNEEHGDEIARDLLSSLSGLGLEQSEVCTVPGFENTASNRTEVTNIQQWRTERSFEVIKPDHNARGVV